MVVSAIAKHSKYFTANTPKPKDKQICFMHIGKTAGTSFFYLLREHFTKLHAFHGSPEQFDRITHNELTKYDLITGHFSFVHTTKFNSDRYLITFLRDPVERVLSSYCFLREWEGLIDDSNHAMVDAAKRLSLLEFLKCDNQQVMSVTNNHQSWALTTDWRAYRDTSDEKLLNNALRNVNTKINFIGLTEYYENSVSLFFNDIGLPKPPIHHLKNVTQKKINSDELNKLERKYICQLNAVDIEVYKIASEIYMSRIKNSCLFQS